MSRIGQMTISFMYIALNLSHPVATSGASYTPGASFTYRGLMCFISSDNKFMSSSSTNCSFMRFASNVSDKFMLSTYCRFMRFTSSDKFTSSTNCSFMRFASNDSDKFMHSTYCRLMRFTSSDNDCECGTRQ